jgi:phenylalanyl-tRNA synthetase beta chain
MLEIGFLLRNLGLEKQFTFESDLNSDFIKGRSGTIKINGKARGFFGEISPEILTNFGIGYPVVAFEILMSRSTDWIN